MLLNLSILSYRYSLNITGVYHIGGYIGEEAAVYYHGGIKNAIFFEPIPTHFEQLRQRIVDMYAAVPLALGSQKEERKMYVSRTDGGFNNGSGASSSLLEPKLHVSQYPHITFNEEETVQVTTLDSFTEESEVNRELYNMINVDVQGHELEVFKGAKECLENHVDLIICEVNREELYEGCPMVEEIDDFLGQYSFRRLETSWDGGNWGDAFYMKVKNE